MVKCVTSTRENDEFDVTCVTCGEEHLSYRWLEAVRFIREHRDMHRRGR